MLSLDLVRTHRNLSVGDIIRRAGIAKQTYYNLTANPSKNTVKKISDILKAPYLSSLLSLDQLFLQGIKLDGIRFPAYIPNKIQELIKNNHPIFK